MAELTLNEMDSFDFTAPLDEKVIYMDSDEDDKSTIPLIHSEDHEYDDCYNEIFENTCDQIDEGCFDTKHNIIPVKNENKLEVSDSFVDSVIERNCEDENPSFNQHLKVDDCPVLKSHPICNQQTKSTSGEANFQKDIPVKDYRVESHIFSEIDTEQQNPGTEKPYVNKMKIKAVETAEPTHCTKHNSFEHQMEQNNEYCVKISYNIKDIFDTISKNLLLTVQAYREHVHNVMDKRVDLTSTAIHNSKKRYKSVKNQYYQLSYSAVVNLILPQEINKNTKFTEEFLNDTVKYGQEKMNLFYAAHDLQPFYHELVYWAIKKKHFIENQCNLSDFYDNVEEIRKKRAIANETPLLSEQLAKPTILPQNPNLSRMIHQQTRQVSDSVATVNVMPNCPDYSNLNQPTPYQTWNQSNLTNRTKSTNRTKPTESIGRYVVNETVEHPKMKITSNPKPNSTIARNSYYNNNISQASENVALAGKKNTTPNHFNYMFSQMDYNSRESDKHGTHTDCNISAGTVSTTSHYNNNNKNLCNYSVDPYRQYQNNYYQRVDMRTTIPPPPSYYSSLVQYPKKSTNQAFIRDQCRPNVENSRSSVSTDSGFASPVQFNTNTQQTQVSSSEDGQLAPFITHVTSLNPKAMPIAEGLCFLCGGSTHKKCLGCYQIYYCSTGCQALDWNRHKGGCFAPL